ncbi:MAG: acetyl-CoA carboxylase biotin carboxyl carrier protein subunit [Bacteroidota bacterium]
MYTIKTNNSTEYKVDIKTLSYPQIEGIINNDSFSADIIKVSDGVFHLIKNNTSYLLEIVKHIQDEKKLIVKINNSSHTLIIKDKYDELLDNLGLDTFASKKISSIKAPMPGMVFKILVKELQEVKKGDPLIILEAMKMENVLKSPTDGIIKKINVNQGVAVEKNQLLIQF